MKKFLLITTILFCILIGGCSEKNEQVADVEKITIDFEQLAYEEFINNLPLLPENDLQLLKEYRKEVIRRIESEDSFLSEQESEILEEHEYYGGGRLWYKLENKGTISMNMQSWYAPIFYKDNNDDIILVLTDLENGMVLWRDINDLYYDPSAWIGNIHKDETEELDKIYELARNSLIEYDTKNQKINIWAYGELEKNFPLSENAKFVGKGEVGELYFREKSKVYRFSYEKDWSYTLIADKVKEVVVTNYYFDYKHYCQPLFLMKDGTLKVYIEIEGVEANSKECLQLILNEGGYK